MFERFLVGPSLEFGGVALEDLATTFGTPLYVVDSAVIRARIRQFRSYAGEAHIAYACKANSALAVLSIVREEGIDVDVASLGEFEAASRAGYEPFQMTVHGNAKSDLELHRAATSGVRRVVVDNFDEIQRLSMLASSAGRQVSILVRVAPGVDTQTHRAIRTGQDDSKFGFNIANGDAAAAIEQASGAPGLLLKGVHFHVGSQLMNAQAHTAAIKRVGALCRATKPFEEIVVGGGLGIRYTPDDEPQEVGFFIDAIRHAIKREFGDGPPSIGFEPGRWIVGEAGTTIYSVASRKMAGGKSIVAVNGGLADNPRPQLYGAKHVAFNGSRPGEEHNREFRIVGRHCENDTLIEAATLPESTEVGDLIAIPSTGAYNFAMASNYNRYPRPAMVTVEGGEAFLAVERESLDELFRTEKKPPARPRNGPETDWSRRNC
jgi:diaminopimelate decarboxylase